jgi:hypothetical protein
LFEFDYKVKFISFFTISKLLKKYYNFEKKGEEIIKISVTFL